MSRRLLVSSSAAALALVLAAPTAALADSGQDGEHGKNGDHRDSAASSSKGSDSTGDPAGNNGTIKIDYPAPTDSGHANRPHPGCAFQLRMFNFDDDQYGTITFVGQAPTKGVVTLAPQRRLLSSDAAGGGQDVDEVYSYTADQLGLTGKPQAKQGWHIKVSVDAENAPGGAKHKVFWLKCPAPTAATTTPTTGGAAGAATASSTVTTKSFSSETTEAATGTSAAAGSTTTSTSTLRAASVGSGETATGFTGGSGSAALSAIRPAAVKRTASVNRGSALPFTGAALGTMLAVALGALVAGGLAIRAGRRRTAADL